MYANHQQPFNRQTNYPPNGMHPSVYPQIQQAPNVPEAAPAGPAPTNSKYSVADIQGKKDYLEEGLGKAKVAAKVVMISGCRDEQTSADLPDITKFGIPPHAGPGGAGGACTSALQHCIHNIAGEDRTKNGQYPYKELLVDMKKFLSQKGYTQLPQLSSTRPLEMKDAYELRGPKTRRTRALLIGINYVGQQGELNGCHNDVKMMQTHLQKFWGFDTSPSSMRVLMDDGNHDHPTKANILQGFRWLVAGAQEGDALFLHYSGHGGLVPDKSGDEKSGMDSTLIPVDYQAAGQIIDDDVFSAIIAPLPAGAELFALMDCCHSGTVMDLAYNIKATNDMQSDIANGRIASLLPNPRYSAHSMRYAALLAAAAAPLLAKEPVGCCLAVLWNAIKGGQRGRRAQ